MHDFSVCITAATPTHKGQVFCYEVNWGFSFDRLSCGQEGPAQFTLLVAQTYSACFVWLPVHLSENVYPVLPQDCVMLTSRVILILSQFANHNNYQKLWVTAPTKGVGWSQQRGQENSTEISGLYLGFHSLPWWQLYDKYFWTWVWKFRDLNSCSIIKVNTYAIRFLQSFIWS